MVKTYIFAALPRKIGVFKLYTNTELERASEVRDVKADLVLKLQKLKSVDDLVDFSRSSLQLEVLLFLGYKKRARLDEMASELGFRRKALGDTLRKLVAKKLVIKGEKDYFTLTETGERYLSELMDIIGVPGYPKKPISSVDKAQERLRFIIEELPTSSYIYDAIVSLGSAKNHELSLDRLSRIVGLGGLRLQSYLDLFVDAQDKNLRLFRKYHKPTLLSRILNKLGFKIKRSKVYYRLSDKGLTVYYRLPHYVKFKHNTFACTLAKLMGSGHPKYLLRQSFLIVCLGSAIAYFLIALFPRYVWLFSQAWFLVLLVTLFLTIFASR
ncbi:MAG: hypothetical protein DRJ33_08210 [Candidatus Methanomethylicota archaeon]|uniref:Uncharacterized protein n=1 Tax=Thermoproteota archaeon TaxID=2056631 RepID=A0A497EQ46_9CREN|nr:MAG: hypothetical protein DRJ33_08210 [Candidatus Verstraetearchaeota archaeon]